MKAHPFFKDLDWNNLLNQEIPLLDDEEETRKFHDRHTVNPDSCLTGEQSTSNFDNWLLWCL